MNDEQDFRPSLSEFAASLLEQLEPLSPASIQLSARPLRVTDWSGVSAQAGPPSELRTTESTDTDREVPRTPARRPGGDPKANLRRNRHRGRERRDLLYLQAYSQLLEKRLQELKKRREENAALSVEQRQDQRLQQSRVELWRALAMRQRHERRQSEQENARLRALWRSQLQFAAQVQALAAVPRALGPANGHEARVTFCDFDADVLAALVRDLDIVYEQSGRALQDVGLADVPDACFKTVRPRDRDGTGNIDLLDVLRVQSSYRTLRELTWDSIISKLIARGGVRVKASQQQDNSTLLTMKLRYHMTPLQLTSQQDEGRQKAEEEEEEDWYFEVVLALRKYVISPDREMAVWKSLITGDGGLLGLATSETGYSVMHSSVEDPQFTTFTRVRRLEPMADHPVTTTTRLVPPSSGSSSSVGDDGTTSMADFFSKLSLSAMEDDVHGALRTFGFD